MLRVGVEQFGISFMVYFLYFRFFMQKTSFVSACEPSFCKIQKLSYFAESMLKVKPQMLIPCMLQKSSLSPSFSYRISPNRRGKWASFYSSYQHLWFYFQHTFCKIDEFLYFAETRFTCSY